MSPFRVYEKQVNGSLLELNVLGEYNGQDVNGAPVLSSLSISNVDQAALPLTPLTPLAFAGTMLSRTSASLTWVAPDNTGRPPITEYRIFRSDDGGTETYIQTVSSTTYAFTDSPVPVNTPEIVFRYTVRAVNSDGVGDSSNIVTLQYNGVVTQGPTAPTGLGYSQLAQTSVRLTWSETFDASITKHGIFKANTLVVDNLDPTALTYLWTGLSSGVQQVNVNVRRYNPAFGWSPASNSVTFTPLTGTVAHDIVMGTSPESVARNTFSQWDAIRSYRISSANSQVASFGCRIIAITDTTGTIPREGGAASATILQNFLEDFYYGSGSAARQNIEVHFANGNELSRDYVSGSLPTALITTHSLMYDVIHRMVGGVRRYPNASMWVDMTNYTITNQGAGPRFKPIAPYLDGFACSMYPTGRLTTGSPRPLWPSTYGPDIDDTINTLIDWRTLNPNLNQFATWENGTPIDQWSNVAPVGDPSAQTNLSIRPRFFMGGRDSTGKNWVGFMNYLYTMCDANGIIMREQLWWDNVTTNAIPYPFYHDKGLITPDTEHAWRNWTPGSTLADA
jgi:hypothetical protein